MTNLKNQIALVNTDKIPIFGFETDHRVTVTNDNNYYHQPNANERSTSPAISSVGLIRS